MSELYLLGLCGALRKGSTNRLFLREAARRFGPARFEEADLDLPLYNGDVEDAAGIPDGVTRLASQIAQADAVIVSTPEYNKGIPGVLKNALDWVSRTPGQPWRDTPVAIISAAAGRAGGERSQNMARLCLTPFRPHLLTGPEVMLAQSSKQFDDDGRLTNEITIKGLQELMDGLRAAATARQADQ